MEKTKKMTKNDLVNICIGIRDSYKNKTPLNVKDKEWLLNEIFRYHPEWSIKSCKDIKDIIVLNNLEHLNTRCFYLVYTDGTYDDISFRWCIQNRPKYTMI